ncbi:uncharacterized protein LOC129228515 [Uloborus diversus]|uniref:uncharacterized protein LOC129228515 n=1 Tax=Uloborus diversus TaxID=327109 RepID=UPI0024098814|nr:uncharacterized protein LOC129228515 [Uloborus diversus]
MAFPEVLCGKLMEDNQSTSLNADKSFTSDDKSFSANSSFGNSPLLDKEKLMRYSVSSRDEFWDALSTNYDFLMDDGLIATCREASSDLSLDDEHEMPETCCWSFNQFMEQFKWLHDLLHNLQVAKKGDKSKKILEEEQKIAYLYKLFNEQAQKLSEKYPDMRDDVHRHLNLLNNKWKAVEQSIYPNKVKTPSKDCVFEEIANRMRNLRKWLREVEDRLCPVNLSCNWTFEKIEERMTEQESFQKEIEAKGKYVSSLLKLCEHLKGNVRFGQNSLMVWDAERVRRVAENLEHRWHSIWLKSIECHCILEQLIENSKSGAEKLDKSFSEEPLKKYPRLSEHCDEIALLENELRSKMSYKCDNVLVDDCLDELDHELQVDVLLQTEELTPKNDKAVMVGDTGITKLKAESQGGTKKFEIVQDVGYSSETSAHFSNDEKLDNCEIPMVESITKVFDKSSPSATNLQKFYLAPDKYPSVSLKALHFLSEEKPFYHSSLNKTVPDSFYKVTSVDDELLEELTNFDEATASNSIVKQLSFSPISQKTLLDGKDIKDLASISNYNSKDSQVVDKDINDKCLGLTESLNVQNDLSSPSSTLKKNKKLSKVPKSNISHKSNHHNEKRSQVQAWLNTCHSTDECVSDDNLGKEEKSFKDDASTKTVDSSCDASGEYTTTESDSEKSNASDVNNSVTLSQSFTGSIETVIPSMPESKVELNEKTGTIETPSSVRLRKKKRTNRDRPWSVTDVHQTFTSSPAVPHSTSESALDLLYNAQDSRKIVYVSFILSENKRLSLTNIHLLNCPSIKSSKYNQNSTKSSNHRTSSGSEKTSRKKKSSSARSSDNNDCSYAKPDSFKTIEVNSDLKSKEILPGTSKCANSQESVLAKISVLERSLSTAARNGSVLNSEDHGSVSDQAWDEYQDPPYLSEPYSEQTADEDEVKRLTSFGDDYRAILGSYSDASSSSIRLPKSHKSRTKTFYKSGSEERYDSVMSDSESEDMTDIINFSNRALQYVKNSLKESSAKLSECSTEYVEPMWTCQTCLKDLNAVHEKLIGGCELESLTHKNLQRLQDLIKEFEKCQVKLSNLSHNESEPKINNGDLASSLLDIHCTLEKLKDELNAMKINANNAGQSALSLKHLKINIQKLRDNLSDLPEMKADVLSVSARILRLTSEGGSHVIAPLRDSVTKLYQECEDVYELNCSHLTKLLNLESNWHESVEDEVGNQSETTVQWQPVQVGDSLPKPKVIAEDFHQNTAAEVLVADQYDILMDIQNSSSQEAVQCCVVESTSENLKESVLLSNPPIMKDGDRNDAKSAEQKVCTKERSCFWRALRTAFPIQCALVILYCMSCYMEPNCCENMNNFEFSVLPQLRYLRGPPPV